MGYRLFGSKIRFIMNKVFFTKIRRNIALSVGGGWVIGNINQREFCHNKNYRGNFFYIIPNCKRATSDMRD